MKWKIFVFYNLVISLLGMEVYGTLNMYDFPVDTGESS